jgi:multidrug efflux pump
MRVWLDPVKMTSLGLTADDVIAAIQAQNLQVASGQIGEPPVTSGQQEQLTVLTPGQFSTVPQFENIVVRAVPNGGLVRIKDIAQVELGAQTYNASSALDGSPSATLAVYEAPNANALAISAAIHTAMKQLSTQFPPGLKYAIVYDTTSFVQANIEEILITLGITLVLVVGVVFLFLQDWRATLIPTVAIPVSLIGAFAVLYMLGYSANTVDLFAIVLAITLVVDDAIVVVENVTRHLEENPSMPVADATEQAIHEITGPVIATTLVLVAVFVPVAFISGVTGALYRQFAVTISVALVISAINALTLSPALCALMLRPPKPARFVLFRWFNHTFEFARDRYGRVVRFLSFRLPLVAVGMVAIFIAAFLVFEATPTGFLPTEDQGHFLINVMMPNGASLGRTDAILNEIGDILHKTPGVTHAIQLGGFSIVTGAQGPNAGSVIAIMKPWAERGADQSVAAVMARLKPTFDAIPSAQINSFNPPAIPGLGAAGGLNFALEALRGQSVSQLAPVARALIFAANQNPNLSQVFTGFSADVPQIMVRVDTARAELMGVTPAAIYDTLEANLGGEFVNNFNYQNFVFQVMVQDQPRFRAKIADINQLYVRNSHGAMVPLRGLVSVTTIVGADAISLYNLYPAVLINGTARLGSSSGQAMAAMQQVAAQHLPAGFGYDWTSISYQELRSAGQEFMAFLAAIVFSFLFLVALYESWTLPFSVMLPVAFAFLGGLVALRIRSIGLDVYGQIGLVLLIGLAAKNAILIVAFAKDRLASGHATIDAAAEEGARTRYRPVMMTALAFIVGVIPLVLATGAGAAARQSIGTAVFGGMVLASFVGVLFVPALFVGFERLAAMTQRLVRRRGRPP